MATATLAEAVADVTDEAVTSKPVKKFRFRGISVSVFENKTKDDRIFHKATDLTPSRCTSGNERITRI